MLRREQARGFWSMFQLDTFDVKSSEMMEHAFKVSKCRKLFDIFFELFLQKLENIFFKFLSSFSIRLLTF